MDGRRDLRVVDRLALLCLPDTALDALHAARITLDVATALTAAVDHPDLIDHLVTQRGLSVGQVESAHRKLLADLAVSEVGTRIEATGIVAVGEDEWRANQSAWKTLDELGLDAEAHRGESCHTVVVKARYDGTVVEIPACTEPRRHRGRKPDSELVAPRIGDDVYGAGSWLIMGDAKDYERVRSRIDDGRMLKGFLQVALGAE